MTKRQDERRELLKEDEIHSFLEKVARYIQQNFMKVCLGTLAFFALVALIFFMRSHKASQSDQEAQALYSAEKILDSDSSDPSAEKFASEKDRYEKALAELDKVIADSSGVVKQQALLRKVNVLIHLGRQSEIEALYQKVISDDNGLKVFGHVGLGNYYQGEGKYQEALDQFEKIKAVSGIPNLNDLVRYKKGLCLKEMGDFQKAKSELSQLVDTYANETDANKKPPILSKAQTLLEEVNKEIESAGGDSAS